MSGLEPKLALISQHLCPYGQRVAIALLEKGLSFERVYIDPANKPDWFLRLSPLGKVPMLKVGDAAVFESTAILEFLEDTQGKPLHPADPLRRAEHRAWIAFGSSLLDGVRDLYSATGEAAFTAGATTLGDRFGRLETRARAAPFFDGEAFSLVDAVIAPVFRYFDVVDRIGDFGILRRKPKIAQWRKALAERRSVRDAVTCDYPARLWAHVAARKSYLSAIMPGPEALLNVSRC